MFLFMSFYQYQIKIFFAALPQEMILRIFYFLPIEDLSKNVSKVCWFWHDQAKFLLKNYKNVEEFSQKLKEVFIYEQWMKVVNSKSWEHLSPCYTLAARKKIVSVCISKMVNLEKEMAELEAVVDKSGDGWIWLRKPCVVEVMELELLQLLYRIKKESVDISMKWSENLQLKSEGLNILYGIFCRFISFVKDGSKEKIFTDLKDGEWEKKYFWLNNKSQSWLFASSVLVDFQQIVNLVTLKYKENSGKDSYEIFFEKYKKSGLKFSKDSCLFMIPPIMEELIKEKGSSGVKDTDLQCLEEVTRYFST
jgi:hypothetical protein